MRKVEALTSGQYNLRLVLILALGGGHHRRPSPAEPAAGVLLPTPPQHVDFDSGALFV